MGGGEYTLLDLMSHIDRKDYYPVLVCPKPGVFSEKCKKLHIEVNYVPTLPAGGGRARDNLYSLIPNFFAIYNLIKKNKIDLVHANHPRTAYHSGPAARISGIPHITHIREINNLPFRSAAKSLFLDKINDRIIAVSCATHQAILESRKSLKNKVSVIYDGLIPQPQFTGNHIEALRNELRITSCFPVFAVIGSIIPLKGQEIIVQAMPTILDKYPRAACLIVGEPFGNEGRTYQKRLQKIVDELGISDHIVWTGFRNDVSLIMASIDVLIHTPTLPDAFPHVLLEAGAQSTVIVASDIGGIREIVYDRMTGRLVAPDQPTELASVVLSLLANPSESEKFGQAAAGQVREKFSIEQHVNQVQSIYKELLSPHENRH